MACTHMYSPVARVGTDQPSYTVFEGAGQLDVSLMIICGRIPPGQECQIAEATVDGIAIGELIRGNTVLHQC